MRHPETAERFKAIFGRVKNSTVEIFGRRNHCFNFKYRDPVPFNKDDPYPLVSGITEFVYQNT